jgi:hypothetical protein
MSPAAGDDGLVAVSAEHFMWFVDTALDQMAVILRELGDDLANEHPPLEEANSPYAILNHCLGVMEYWGGATVVNRPIERDREAEFLATGHVAELLARTSVARGQLEEDLRDLNSMAKPTNVPGWAVPYNEVKGAVLLHILEELYQHLGQMELTRDMLLADR